MTVLLVDAMNLLWRTVYMFPNGAESQFLLSLAKVVRAYDLEPIVAWEGRTNFRRDLFSEYKNRDRKIVTEEGVIVDVSDAAKALKKFLKYIGVRQYVGNHCEADDVIGRLAFEKYKKHGVLIFSNDSDFGQLVNKRVHILAPKHGGGYKMLGPKDIKKKHGVKASQIADLKALSGDTSDCIPGLKGVGPKTAVKALLEYGTAEGCVKAAMDGDWSLSERFRKIFAEGEEDVVLYKTLTTIQRTADFKVIKPKQDEDRVRELLREYRMRTAVKPVLRLMEQLDAYR